MKDKVRKFFEERGVELLSDYVSPKEPLHFKCKNCGKDTQILWANLSRRPNTRFLCPDCRLMDSLGGKTLAQIEHDELIPKGIHLTSYNQSHLTNIQYVCPECGQIHSRALSVLRSCKRVPCDNRFTIEQIDEKYFKPNGVKLLSTKYTSNNSPLEYECPVCGAILSTTLASLSSGDKTTFICKDCRSKTPSREEFIEKYVIPSGIKLLTEGEFTYKTKIEFICKCGIKDEILLSSIVKNKTKIIRCRKCSKHAKPTIEFLNKNYFEPAGAILLDKEYVNARTPIHFKCSNCGEEGSILWLNLSRGFNKELYCKKCLGLTKTQFLKDSKVNSYQEFKSTRLSLDRRFNSLAKKFFGVSAPEKGKTSHHIFPYASNPELRTSFTNIYPLSTSVHYKPVSKEEVDFINKIHFPQTRPRLLPPDYPKEYWFNNIKPLNLWDKVATEVILMHEFDPNNPLYTGRVDATVRSSLLDRKIEFHNKGILYLPFYEYELNKNPELVFSVVRNKLYPWFPDIHAYTGNHLTKIYARKTSIQEVDAAQAKQFYESNHMMGYAPAALNIGLVSDEKLVSIMSFAKARFSSEEYEIIRFATDKNHVVVGAGSKLFSHFLKLAKPNSVISYCDLRFSEYEGRAVYDTLGFSFVGYTPPNYRYYNKNDDTFLSRNYYQKGRLRQLLPIFDESLTEVENCKANGLTQIFDCGNKKFVWKPDD